MDERTPEEFYDVGLIINSLEEKIASLKEKISLLAKSLVELREDFDKRMERIEKENTDAIFKIDDMKRKVDSVLGEIPNFVKKEELILIERMLKDFQPLEFVRKKDIEEYLKRSINKEKLKDERS